MIDNIKEAQATNGGHYEVIRETIKEMPIYDEDGHQTDVITTVIGREVEWVWDDPEKQVMERKQLQVAAILTRLREMDFDINACEDGQKKAKSIEEYRAERAELRNELRVLQGKPALAMLNK